ncbi:MAG TPA: ABC transporter ATP-binding protein [Candidatus Tectomicrobia bacterium]|jgi:ABC-type lipoprotein export system ATPase subunit
MTHAQLAVTLHGVKKAFPLGNGSRLEVLNIKRLALPAGSYTVLKGPSGSGKTTLLNLIAGIAVPSAGTVRVHNTDIFTLPEPQRDRFRAQHIGYVFQTFNLLAAFSALENVMLSMLFTHAIPKRQQRQRACELLSRLGLGTRLAHKPQHLSRGEQQRVAIARALANNPPLILADEPCASLDAHTAQEVLDAFLTVCREEGKTLLMVSHNEAVLGVAEQVLDITVINRAGYRPDAT